MGNTIQIKRNSTSNAATSGLLVGELGYNTVDKVLYVGTDGTDPATACLTKTGNFVSGNVLIADGTTGRVKDSGMTLGKVIPDDAKLTDTLNTAGATNNTSKLFLIGATAQGANPQTYSRSTTYIDANGNLCSTGITGTGVNFTMDAGTY